MKKILMSILAICMVFALTACGSNPNAAIIKKINKTISKVEKTLKNTQDINEPDFISQDILSIETSNQPFFLKQSEKKDEFVSANIVDKETTPTTKTEIENEEKQTLQNQLTESEKTNRNIDTYFYNNLPRNTNTYFLPPHMPPNFLGGYGGYGGYGVNGGMGGYGVNNNYTNPITQGGFQNMPYPNGQNIPLNPQQPYNNSSKKRISNINTYGLYDINVNSYKKANYELKSTPENKKVNVLANEKNKDYIQYHISKESQQSLDKLTNLFVSGSHLINVNLSCAQEKTRLNEMIASLKEVIKETNNTKQALDSNTNKSINMLLEDIEDYIRKIEFSKNQFKFELNKIKEIKEDFLKYHNELSARYIVLANFLDTRFSYYSSISNCIQNLKFNLIDSQSSAENQTKISETSKNNNENIEQHNLDENSKTEINNSQIEKNTSQTEIKPSQENTSLQNALDNKARQLYKENNVEKVVNSQKETKQTETSETIEFGKQANDDRQTQINNENQVIDKNQSDNQFIVKNQTENKVNSQNQTENIIDGFKKEETEKQEVNATISKFEPVPNREIDEYFKRFKGGKSNYTNNLFLNPTAQEENENIFPSSKLPFKKPKKNDYLKLGMFI
jgi:hypothetical protein